MAKSHFQMLKFKEIYVEIITHNPKYVIMRKSNNEDSAKLKVITHGIASRRWDYHGK